MSLPAAPRRRAGSEPARHPWDAVVLVVLVSALTLLANRWLGNLITCDTEAWFADDFGEYCLTTMAAHNGAGPESAGMVRRMLPGVMLPGVLARWLGLVDGLVAGQMVMVAAMLAVTGLWARELVGRAGLFLAPVLCFAAPATWVAARNLTAYPAWALAMATAGFALTRAIRRPSVASGLLVGTAAGMLAAIDQVGVLLALPLAAAGALALLRARPRGLAVAAVLPPLVASWLWVGSMPPPRSARPFDNPYPGTVRTLDVRMGLHADRVLQDHPDVDPATSQQRQALLQDPAWIGHRIEVATDPQDGFLWGHAGPDAVIRTGRRLAMQAAALRTHVRPQPRFDGTDPAGSAVLRLGLLFAAGLGLSLSLRRDRRDVAALLLPLLPFLLLLPLLYPLVSAPISDPGSGGATSDLEIQTKFQLLLGPGVAVALAAGWTALAARLPRSDRSGALAAQVGVALVLVLGLIDNPLSPGDAARGIPSKTPEAGDHFHHREMVPTSAADFCYETIEGEAHPLLDWLDRPAPAIPGLQDRREDADFCPRDWPDSPTSQLTAFP